MKEINDFTRRDFLKKLSLYAGTGLLMSAFPGLNLSGQDKKIGPNDKIRIGVIGVGSRGSLLMLHLLNNPWVEISSVCDDYPPHYERALEMTNHKAKAFWNYRELLEKDKPEAVVIATPLHEHSHMTVNALKAGIHVFCEKAMARTMEETKDMLKAHEKTGKILMIGHQRKFNLKYLKAYEMHQQGYLGKITQVRAWWHRNNDWRRHVPSHDLERKINWRLYDEYSLGLMTELASHQVHVANWFLGEHPVSVMGSGSTNYWRDGREVYDNVNLVYTYPDGTHLIYDSLTSNHQYSLEEQIMGPKGTFELEAGKHYLEFPPPAPGIKQLINQVENSIFDTIPIGGASWVPDSAEDRSGEYFINKNPLPDDTMLQMEAFVDMVKQNKIVPGLAREYFEASVASILGYQAMQEKKIMKWPEGL